MEKYQSNVLEGLQANLFAFEMYSQISGCSRPNVAQFLILFCFTKKTVLV